MSRDVDEGTGVTRATFTCGQNTFWSENTQPLMSLRRFIIQINYIPLKFDSFNERFIAVVSKRSLRANVPLCSER